MDAQEGKPAWPQRWVGTTVQVTPGNIDRLNRERSTLGGEHAALRERTGGFAYFSRDGLVEDRLQEQLEELGFDAPDVTAAYELVERAMNGEVITPVGGRQDQVQFARRSGDQPIAPWPPNFPKVTLQTNAVKLRDDPDYAAAKAGDAAAARRLVLRLAKPDKLRALAAKHPDALILPVRAEEAAGRNRLPAALARYMGKLTGLQVADGVVQTNYAARTGEDADHRMGHRPRFSGPVQSGRSYILVDDLSTMGGTFAELRAYIEQRGGRVVDTTALAAAKFGDNIAITPQTLLALRAQYGDAPLREWLHQHGLYGGEPGALTEAEARWLLGAKGLDAAGDRIAAARLRAGGGRVGFALRAGPEGGQGPAGRQPVAPPRIVEALATEWWRNLERIAPGLAKEAELRFGESDALVEQGLARRDELTGEEEAARVRDFKAKKEIFYLFERALRQNTPDVTRLNLQHEMGHAFWDTLDRTTQRQLLDLFEREVTERTGPLFTADGALRDNVALGATEDVQEWFAERLAHANDAWAKRRIGTRTAADTVIATLAARFRQFLVRLRELLENRFDLNGYEDVLLRNFRLFLDQGTKWTGAEGRGRVDFARRGREVEMTPELAAKTVPVVPAARIEGTSAQELRQAARQAAAEWLGEPIRNDDTGAEIVVSGKSLNRGFSHKGIEHIRAAPALPELIRTAVRIATEPHSPAVPEFKAVHRYAAALNIDGRTYRVKLTTKERANGQQLYDHEANQIEAPDGKLLPRRIPQGKLDGGPSSGATVTISQLFGGVKPGGGCNSLAGPTAMRSSMTRCATTTGWSARRSSRWNATARPTARCSRN